MKTFQTQMEIKEIFAGNYRAIYLGVSPVRYRTIITLIKPDPVESTTLLVTGKWLLKDDGF